MISVVTYGRNDNYSFNLCKRTALSFNCLAEVLTEEDEILFVDYNTPDQLPTLPEFIWDTLTEKALGLVKVIRIAHDVHEKIKGMSPLHILENVSRNAALVRSNPNNRWVLSTNPDILLVLSPHWTNLAELLRNTPDSFYEMPRFDIPESVWSSLDRDDPKTNMTVLRDWLVVHGAATAGILADFCLFDAPGDFQLAPREYFFRIRGFDESMNKYLHSDSNLAKRMWLLNGRRTDHLLSHLWVLHQDHYLSGEWSKSATTIEHNDNRKKVFELETVEANDGNWGLQQWPLPYFPLAEKVRRQRVVLPRETSGQNGDFALSRELNPWYEPFIHFCSYYEPKVISLYLEEFFRIIDPDSRIAYLGEYPKTLECLRSTWQKVSPSGTPVQNLLDGSDPSQPASPDVLLVDCFYDWPEGSRDRIRLLSDQLRRQVAKGQLAQQEADDELNRFVYSIAGNDVEEQRKRLEPFWTRWFPSLKPRAGSYVILLGCHPELPSFRTFHGLFSRLSLGIESVGPEQSVLNTLHTSYQKLKSPVKRGVEQRLVFKALWGLRTMKRKAFRKFFGTESVMGRIYHERTTQSLRGSVASGNLRVRYMHHRLVVLSVEP